MTKPTSTKGFTRGVRRHRAPSWPLGFLLFMLSTGLDCRHGGDPTLARPDPRWTRDSSQYVADSTKWVRDSIVRDSISRTMNTDSLYRLYRRMLYAADPVPLMHLIECESTRLGWRYGSIPATAAIQRMEDTLWRPENRKDEKLMWARLHNMSVEQMLTLGVSPDRCGGWGYPQPVILNGTNLQATSPRPRRPRRP